MSLSRPRKEKQHPQQLQYLKAVIAALQADPEKLNIVKQNIAHYQNQAFLKRGFLRALERMEWLFEANLTIDEFCQQIMADDYIGNRIRRYPLIFKGVLDKA
ncbi:hypothetical protein AN214_01605 [Pseudoalteromonas sp. P1-9]|uniref:hypothetical protein n=1 Tax=Pseudoalteromonas sp. P1-9 TaxID=1710354 RepID=UPI0007078E59|nr:hypothetical protein [Pseudoalteromonas sp. P1-9]KPV96259.1 hypothetical protein AN214_01605 [Pseudoalteromonas sp. P1-9]